jgi:hypothetical protein
MPTGPVPGRVERGVRPRRPEGTERMPEAEPAGLVGRNGLIGTPPSDGTRGKATIA